MKLTYRDRSYQSEPPTIDVMESEFCGKYRGQNWAVRYPRHIPVPEPFDQKSPHVTHRTHETADTGGAATAPPPPAVQARVASFPKTRHIIVSEAAKAHRANICRSLERRMEAALARGDKALIHLLERESAQLTCAVR